MKKIKSFLQKPFIKNIIAPVVRGALQTIPGGGVIVQAGRNISHELNAEKEPGTQRPHNYLSIAVQVIGVACVVYAFTTKAITIEQVLELVKTFIPVAE